MKIIAKKCDNTHDVFFFFDERIIEHEKLFSVQSSAVGCIVENNVCRLLFFSFNVQIFYGHFRAFQSPSRPLYGHSRPKTFHGHLTFSTATLEQSGRHHGHLATLNTTRGGGGGRGVAYCNVTRCCQVSPRFPAQFKKKILQITEKNSEQSCQYFLRGFRKETFYNRTKLTTQKIDFCREI